MAINAAGSGDDDRDEIGEKGEQLVEEALQSKGWNVTGNWQFSDDGAPAFIGANDAVARPDITAYKDGECRRIEVKTKRDGAEYIHIHGEYEHCIDRRLWDGYVSIKEGTGEDVWIFIYEPPTGDLLIAEVDDLKNRHSPVINEEAVINIYGELQIFFKRDLFTEVGSGLDTSDNFFGQQKFVVDTELSFGEDFALDYPDDNGQTGLRDFGGDSP